MTQEQSKVAVELTAEELRHLEELRHKRQAKAERDAYLQLSHEQVGQYLPKIKDLHRAMAELKAEIYEAFQALIRSKEEMGAIKAGGQRSHTFRNEDSTGRITIGYHQRDAWDDTVHLGIDKVKEYLTTLAKDEASEDLVEIIHTLLSPNKQGELQADKVLQLAQHAERSRSPLFKEGVEIIQEAYRPERTKLFIQAEERNDKGAWVGIPLNMTAV